MNLSFSIRLDLSPAFAAALKELSRALGGRGLPPLRPYEKPDWLSAFDQQQTAAEKPAPTPSEPIVQVDTVADIEKPTTPLAERLPEVTADGSRWTDERYAVLSRDYPAGVSLGNLLAKINALPGPPMDAKSLKNAAFRKGLRRPSEPPAVADKPRSTWLPPQRAEPPASSNQVDLSAETDDATIRHWAAQRGLCNGGEALDLERINRKRVELGLLAFVRRNGLRDSSATLRGPAVENVR